MHTPKVHLLIACMSICFTSMAMSTNNINLKTQKKQTSTNLSSNNFQLSAQNGVKFGKNCPKKVQQYVFTSQKDIDNFPSKCKSAPQLIIAGDDITNIDGLKNISKVTGYSGNQISIFIGGPKYSNPSLKQLVGLNNLKKVNGYIDIFGNRSLDSINVFQKLKTIKGQLIISQNPSLTTIAALPSLSKLVSLGIEGNQKLITVDGLFSRLKVLPEDLSIKGNALTTLSFLSSLREVGVLDLSDNNSLKNLDGLQNIKKLTRDKSFKYNAYFERQKSLQDCSQISKLYHADPSRFMLYDLTPECKETLTK